MKLVISDDEFELVLKTFGEKMMVLYMQSKIDEMEEVKCFIEQLIGAAQMQDKIHIVERVFQEMPGAK